MHSPRTGLYSLCSYTYPNRQCVDEKPYPLLCYPCSLHPSQQHCPEHHIFLSRHSRQHLRPPQMAQTRYTHPQFSPLFPQPPLHSCLHQNTRFFDPTPIALHIQQSEGCCRLLYISQHRPEKGLVFLFFHSQPRLGYQIPERQRLRQPIGLSQQMQRDLSLHCLHSHVISRQMMQQEHHQPAILFLILRDMSPQQRRLPHIHPIIPRIETSVKLPTGISHSGLYFHLFHRQHRFTPHHLHRL